MASSSSRGSHCGPDQLSCVASYFCSAAHRRQQQSHGRLPLAWVAASPSARLVAEQRHAWVVLPFETAAAAGCPYVNSEHPENAFGVALANATTPLFVLHAALGLDGTSAGGGDGAGAADRSAAESTTASPTSPSVKVMSWITETTESLADVSHAASPVERRSPTFSGAARPHSPVQKAARPSTGVRGSRVEDPLEAARSCGVHVGGLTTVLVSGVHLYDTALTDKAKALAAKRREGSTAAALGNARQRDAAHRRDTEEEAEPHAAASINASGTLLFPSTTWCGGSVASLLSVPPNAAAFDRAEGTSTDCGGDVKSGSMQSNLFKTGLELHADDGGAEDETAHDPHTAASVYTVQQVNKLHAHAAEGDMRDAFTTVWYRHVFVDAEEVTADALCGVSQWWLQRPVRQQELPSTQLAKALRASRQKGTAAGSKEASLPRSLSLPAPPLYVKYMADIGADLWWPHRLLSVVHHRFTAHRWYAIPLLRWAVFLALLVAVLLESIVRGVPEVPAQHASTPRVVSLVESFYKLGCEYGGAGGLAALDVSHTGVRGEQLLACAMGKVLRQWRGDAPRKSGDEENSTGAVAAKDAFCALDLAGCVQLHHRSSELHSLSPLLSRFLVAAAERVRTQSAKQQPDLLATVDLLAMASLHNEKTRATPRSCTGLALALLSHHGRLTWLSGPGCSLDNAAMRELGAYALLVEAVAVSDPSFTAASSSMPLTAAPSPWACTICAMDLTSALSLDDLNPVGYLAQLEQLLVPFNYVTDDGLVRIDGHTYPQDLHAFLSLCDADTLAAVEAEARAVLERTVEHLRQLCAASGGSLSSSRAAAAAVLAGDSSDTTRGSSSSGSSLGAGTKHKEAVEALHRRFRSHLYQIDFTYCSCLSSINSLGGQQRLQLLNMSQTHINRAGLFSTAKERHRAAVGPATPPLRLFIAEMCEHLGDLSGLAHLTTLECLIVRSGCLGDDGLQAVCTPDMQRLQLVDLSYCDRLHHLSCLTRLPAMETLILDSTDVTPAEVRKLRQSRSLRTLSVRFCTEFAFIGKGLAELEAAIGPFPSLRNYVYEDLVGDAELRKKTS